MLEMGSKSKRFDTITRNDSPFNRSSAKLAAAVVILLMASVILYPENFLKGYELRGGLRISPLIAAMIACLPAIALIIWRSRRELRFTAADLALIITMTYIMIRGLISANGSVSLTGLIILYAFSGLAVYYCSMVVGSDKRLVRIVVAAVVGLTLFIILYAFFEFVARDNFLYRTGLDEVMPQEGSFYRPRSTVGQPIILGALSVGALSLAWMEYKYFMFGWERILGKVALIMLPLGVVLSFSRGSWLLLAGIVALLVAWRARIVKGYKGVYAWALAISGIMILTVTLLNRVQLLFFGRSASLAIRNWSWEGALRTFARNPIFGVGPYRAPGYIMENWGFNFTDPTAVDNFYLTTIAEIGLMGILLIAVTFFLLTRESVSTDLKGRLERVYPEQLITFSVLVGLIGAIVFDTYLIWPTYFLFWLELGILRGARRSGSLRPDAEGKTMQAMLVDRSVAS